MGLRLEVITMDTTSRSTMVHLIHVQLKMVMGSSMTTPFYILASLAILELQGLLLQEEVTPHHHDPNHMENHNHKPHLSHLHAPHNSNNKRSLS